MLNKIHQFLYLRFKKRKEHQLLLNFKEKVLHYFGFVQFFKRSTLHTLIFMTLSLLH
jgi:hypothetical protein